MESNRPRVEARARSVDVQFRVLLTLIVVAGAVALVAALLSLVRTPIGHGWFVLLACTVVTGSATLRMRQAPISFSISDTFTIAATLLYGTAAGTVLAVIDALVMTVRVAIDRRTGVLVRAGFNACATALAMWVAGSVFFTLAGSGPLATEPAVVRDVAGPLALFTLVYFLLSTAFVAVAVAFDRRESIMSVWRRNLSGLWLAYFSGTSIAATLILMTVGNLLDVRSLIVFLPLLIILHMTYRAALDRAAERLEHHAQLTLYAEGLRSTAEGVLMIDGNGVVTFANRVAERLLKRGDEPLIGRRLNEVWRLHNPRTVEPEDLAMGAEGPQEFVLDTAIAGQRPIEERHAAIFDENGVAVGTVITFQDISARKLNEAERENLLQREREARERADAANRLKDEFLATVSHELRTPATAILGWARLLKTGRLSAVQASRAIEGLERGAYKQARLLEDLLDMSRITRGTLHIDVADIDLRPVLDAALETVISAIRSKRITLTCRISRELPTVRGDPDRLRQIFWNLLSNAVKFTDAEGAIDLSVYVEGQCIYVRVTDTGTGIDAEALPYVFDRFRQADGSSTRLHGGLGVGLAIVRYLVELHGGTVTAESEGVGRGARFTISLPVTSTSLESRVPRPLDVFNS